MSSSTDGVSCGGNQTKLLRGFMDFATYVIDLAYFPAHFTLRSNPRESITLCNMSSKKESVASCCEKIARAI